MKQIAFTILSFLGLSIGSIAQVVYISTARTIAQGQSVAISGIVMNEGTLGPIRYIQDATGGLPVYDPSVTNNWNQGDSVTVAGVMGEFMGLIQITNTTSSTVHATNRPLPDAMVVPPNNIGINNEGTLVKVNNVTFVQGGGTFTSSTYAFTDDNGASSVIYLRSGHPLIGTTIPLAAVNLTGLSSQFNGTPQLLPRDGNDMEIAATFYMTGVPAQSNLSKTSFTVSWETNENASSHVRYGETPAMAHVMNQGGSTMSHSVDITGLTAGRIYYVEAFSVNATGDTVTAQTKTFATVSNSSGVIEIYFNQVVDNGISTGTNAIYLTGAQVESKIIEKINHATTTIDCAFMNNSRATIVTALNNALNRGVQVRYISNIGSANTALTNAQFPKIAGNGTALMHNKIIIVDAHSTDSAWVFTGSMNITDDEIVDNYNNVLFIQDESLARAYTLEFEEMWGTNTATPGIFSAKFGGDKTDNTPHQFIIGGILVESYFSPSDGTTSKISKALRSADTDLAFALFSFTRNDLREDIINRHNAGVSVRGMIENINDTGGEYNNLNNAGVPMKAHPEDHLLHHKYAIVDATNPNADPIVITGCHNWSTAAETRNDENTLIIHDATIANLFEQEFNARWLGWVTGVKTVQAIQGFYPTLYPVPANDILNLELDNTLDAPVQVYFINMKGQILKTVDLQQPYGQTNHRFDVSDLAAGHYFVGFQVGNLMMARKVLVVK